MFRGSTRPPFEPRKMAASVGSRQTLLTVPVSQSASPGFSGPPGEPVSYLCSNPAQLFMGLQSVCRFPHTDLETCVFDLCGLRIVSCLLRQVLLGAVSHVTSLPKFPCLLLQLKPFLRKTEHSQRCSCLSSLRYKLSMPRNLFWPRIFGALYLPKC